MKAQHHFRALILLALFFVGHAVRAQIELPVQLQEAITLSKKYPYAPIVATDAEVKYTFLYLAGDGGTVTAQERSEETLMSLRDGYVFEKFVSTDTHTSIAQSVYYKDKNLQSARSWPTTECASNFSMEIFDTDQEVCSYELYFDEIGDRRKYAIKKGYDDLKYLTKAYVLDYHPSQQKRLVFDVPSWLKMEFIELNFDGLEFTKTSVALTSTLERITYTFTDLPESSNPNGAPGKSYYEPQIALVFKSFNKGEEKPLMATIQDQYQWYKSLVDEVEVDDTELEKLVDQILAGKQTEQEKIEAIYYWVQDNIRYIAFERGIMGFRPEPAHKVCSKRFGDCKGMANLTKSMLRIAGFDARLTWIGTNYISPAYNYSFPSLANDNHMICTLIWNDKKYFLDGTESYCAFGDNAARIQGRNVMIEDGENYIIDSVPMQSGSVNSLISTVDFNYENGALQGVATLKLNGEEKRTVLQQYQNLRSNLKDNAIKGYLQEGLAEMKVSDYKSSDLGNRNAVVNFDYNFDLLHHTLSVGDELYVNLEYQNSYRSFFIDSTRTVPIELGNTRHIKSEANFAIPTGYKVKSLPEGFTFSQDGFDIKISMNEEAGKVVYSKEITVDYRLISPDMIPAWNTAMMGLEKVYNHYIVMQKL